MSEDAFFHAAPEYRIVAISDNFFVTFGIRVKTALADVKRPIPVAAAPAVGRKGFPTARSATFGGDIPQGLGNQPRGVGKFEQEGLVVIFAHLPL